VAQEEDLKAQAQEKAQATALAAPQEAMKGHYHEPNTAQ
jgi:hypothetical protein